jgi:hypothetical protein
MGVILDRIASGKERGISTVWLNFYGYVRIPFGVLIWTMQSIPEVFRFYPSGAAFLTLALFALYLCIFISLFIGLHRRHLWGWRLNWFALIFEVLVVALNGAEDAISFFISLIIWVLVWIVPNAIYFKKRRFLFS